MKSSKKTSMTHLLLFEDFRYVLTLLISLFAMLLNYALVQLAVTAVGVKKRRWIRHGQSDDKIQHICISPTWYPILHFTRIMP